MNGWYDSTLDDYLAANDLAGAKKHVDWLAKNCVPNVGVKNYNTLYGATSLLTKPIFKQIAKYAYGLNVRFGIAYDNMKTIDKVIAYNKLQPDETTKLKFIITEIEPYNNAPMGYSAMTSLISAVAPKASAAGLRTSCYMGWPKDSYWKTIVQYNDEINLHCYKKSDDTTPKEVWGYVDDRLELIAAACKALNKKTRISIIFSNEPSFGYDFFESHSWDAPMKMFMEQYNKYASPLMKAWLEVGDEYIFKVKYGKQLKPLVP